jgi:hypothetical protein
MEERVTKNVIKMETAMKKTGLVVLALAAMALSACAGRYYDRDRYYGERYGPGPGGGVYYSDVNPNNRYYTDYPNREYRDRDGRRYDSDRDR